MFCRRCGTKIPDDSKFCQVCGTEVIALKSSIEPTQPDVVNEQAYYATELQAEETVDTQEHTSLAEETIEHTSLEEETIVVSDHAVVSDAYDAQTINEIATKPSVTEVEELLESKGIKGTAEHYGISDVNELRQIIHKAALNNCRVS